MGIFYIMIDFAQKFMYNSRIKKVGGFANEVQKNR